MQQVVQGFFRVTEKLQGYFIRPFLKKKSQNKTKTCISHVYIGLQLKKGKRKHTDIQKGGGGEREKRGGRNGCSNTDSKLKWKTVSP